ncbi:hypothetical protein E2C01_052400 [Portunus trituberculatus]|uniref:Secreted protein n=1 Tax=Portunus trituberculatus TaxID=210409 RepID=A0A5B7GLG1_PORTR|nr:hypothetical protein [Portunus trituberculatus]
MELIAAFIISFLLKRMCCACVCSSVRIYINLPYKSLLTSPAPAHLPCSLVVSGRLVGVQVSALQKLMLD